MKDEVKFLAYCIEIGIVMKAKKIKYIKFLRQCGIKWRNVMFLDKTDCHMKIMI
jgi:hypothetical protein